MADDDDQQPRGFGFTLPAGLIHALAQEHDTHRAQGEDRYLTTMRWLDSLDTEGLMALRYVLASDADDAYGNCRFYDGMCMTLLRLKGVDPRTGRDPAADLLADDGAA